MPTRRAAWLRTFAAPDDGSVTYGALHLWTRGTRPVWAVDAAQRAPGRRGLTESALVTAGCRTAGRPAGRRDPRHATRWVALRALFLAEEEPP